MNARRGDYFAYLGSDDLWLPDFLKARVGLLESRPDAVLAYGHAYFIDEENHIVDSTADWARYADGDAREMLLQTTAPMSPTVLYRRDALEQQRWNEASKLEDYDLYLRLSAEGPFAFDPQSLVSLAPARFECQLGSNPDVGRTVAGAASGGIEIWFD